MRDPTKQGGAFLSPVKIDVYCFFLWREGTKDNKDVFWGSSYFTEPRLADDSGYTGPSPCSLLEDIGDEADTENLIKIVAKAKMQSAAEAENREREGN